MKGAVRKRFRPCCGYFLQGALKWICVANIVFVGVGLLVKDMVKKWNVWLIEKREDPHAFTVRYSHWIAFWLHVATALPLDIYLFKASRKRNTKGIMIWIVGTFFTASWAGVVYYLHTASVGLDVETIAIYNGYLIYRYYTLIVVYYYVKEIREDENALKACRQLTDQEIKEFFEEGLPIPKSEKFVGVLVSEKTENSNHYVNSGPHIQIDMSQVEMEKREQQLEYCRYRKEELEISMETLLIDENQELGAGAYGKVYKALLKTRDGQTPKIVAVKTINEEGCDVALFKALLSELKVMSYIGQHDHIVTLLGASTSDIKNKKLYIVVEFCAFGSLFDYLKGCRGLFSSLVKDGILQKRQSENDDYTNYKETDGISTSDLLKWSYQMADGMYYLECKKVVHGDLAARNVLLTGEKNVKITDFGLSRQLYQYSVYVKKQNTPLPWRWLAPESITDMNFSTKSDIWSYGVTVWEIFSLCETPWPKQVFDLDFMKKLKNGMRLSMPPNCSEEIYEALLHCWRKEPSDRPSFDYLCRLFKCRYNYVTS